MIIEQNSFEPLRQGWLKVCQLMIALLSATQRYLAAYSTVIALEYLVMMVFELTLVLRSSLMAIWHEPFLQELLAGTYPHNAGFDLLRIELVVKDDFKYLQAGGILIGVFLLTLFLTGLFAGEYISHQSLLLFYACLLKYQRVLCVVLMSFVMAGWSCSDKCSSSTALMRSLLLGSWLPSTLLVLVYTALSVCPLKKLSPVPSAGTSAELISFLGGLLKALIVGLYGTTNTSLLALAVIDMLRLTTTDHHSYPSIRIVLNFTWVFTLLTELTALIAGTTTFNTKWLMMVWFGLLLLSCGECIRRLFEANKKRPFLPIACQTLTNFQLLQLVFALQLRNAEQSKDMQDDKQFQTCLDVHIRSCKAIRCYLRENQKQILASLSSEAAGDGSQSSAGSQRQLMFHVDAYILVLLQQRSAADGQAMVMILLHLYNKGLLQKLQHLHKRNLSGMVCRFMGEYLVYLGKNTTRELNDDSSQVINDQKYKEVRADTIASLKLLAKNMRSFVSQLKEKRLRLAGLQQFGIICSRNIDTLKQQFLKLQKLSHTDLLLTQFYLQLFQNVLRHQQYVTQTVKGIRQRFATKKKSWSFQEVPMPAIRVEGADRNRVVSVNAETLKLLKRKKEQLLDVQFSSLIVPNFDGGTSRDIFDRSAVQPLMCLVRTQDQCLIPASLQSQTRHGDTKRQHFYQMSVQHLNSREWVILINSQSKAVQIHPEDKQEEGFDIHLFIESSLMKQVEKLTEQQHLRLTIPLGRRSVLVQILPCILPHVYFIKIEYLLPCHQNTARMTVLASQLLPIEPIRQCKDFHFTYQLQQQLTAIGSFSRFQHRMTVNLKKLSYVGAALLKCYNSGISTYRLSGQRIYCLDLEKAEDAMAAAPQLVESSKVTNEQRKLKLLHIVIYVLIVAFVGLLTAGLVLDQNILESRQLAYQRLFRMQEFKIRFYHALGILRDASGPHEWQLPLLEEITSLSVKSHSGLLFNANSISFSFRNQSWHDQLDEITSVVIAELYLIGKSGNLTFAGQLLQATIKQVFPSLEAQQESLENEAVGYLDLSVSRLYSQLAILLAVHLLIMGAFFLQHHYRGQQRQSLMMPFRMLSDEYLLSLDDRLNTFEALLELSQRNDDIEVYSQMHEDRHFRSRQSPKKFEGQAAQRKGMIALSLILTVALIGVFGYIPFSRSTSNEGHALRFACSITNVYSRLLRDSLAEFQPSSNPTALLDYIEQSKDGNLFSSEYNSQIETIFFNSSCRSGDVPGVYCGATFGNGRNPFLAGLIYYLNNMIFSLVDNKSAVYPCTGVLGGKFRDLFVYLVQRNSAEMAKKVANQHSFWSGYALLEYLFAVLLALAGFVGWLNNRWKVKIDKQILQIIHLEQADAVASQPVQSIPQNTLLSNEQTASIELL